MAAQHTPGPWEIVGDGELQELVVRSIPGAPEPECLSGEVCRITFEGSDEESATACRRKADAGLIAAAPDLLAILDELEGSFDEQTYQEKAREDFDAPDDREYSVNITAKQLRAISSVLLKTQVTPAATRTSL